MSTRERDAGMPSSSIDDKGKRPDVGEPSPPIKASNTTSKDNEGDTYSLVGQPATEEQKEISKENERTALLLGTEREASVEKSKKTKNDATADIPFPDPPVPKPPSVPGSSSSSGSSFTDPSKFFSTAHALYGLHENTLPPSFLLPLLKPLGMSKEIHEDELGRMLHLSGYIDDSNANMNRKQFSSFDSDFKLLQAFQVLRTSKSGPALDRSDLILLNRFFTELEAGIRSRSSKPHSFRRAFHTLGLKLKNDDCYSLKKYSLLPPSDPVNFEQFLTDEVINDLTISMDRNQRYHRIMLFVSMYIRRNDQEPLHHPTRTSQLGPFWLCSRCDPNAESASDHLVHVDHMVIYEHVYSTTIV